MAMNKNSSKAAPRRLYSICGGESLFIASWRLCLSSRLGRPKGKPRQISTPLSQTPLHTISMTGKWGGENHPSQDCFAGLCCLTLRYAPRASFLFLSPRSHYLAFLYTTFQALVRGWRTTTKKCRTRAKKETLQVSSIELFFLHPPHGPRAAAC